LSADNNDILTHNYYPLFKIYKSFVGRSHSAPHIKFIRGYQADIFTKPQVMLSSSFVTLYLTFSLRILLDRVGLDTL
jgi:hypothetical protein